jgi:hypothetical protein
MPNGCCNAECYSQTLGTSAKFPNPVEVDSINAVQICLPNTQRKETILVNTGTTVIKVGLGLTPTQTAYSFALPPCNNSNDDGSGGVFVSDMWQGSIFAISDADGGSVCFTEEV